MIAFLKLLDLKTWAIYGLGILCLLLGLHTWSTGNRYEKLKRTHDKLLIDLRVAEGAAKALEGTATASAELAKGVAAQRRSIASTASKKELDNVIKTDPPAAAWAAAPVPPGVRSALQAARARAAQPAASGPAG